MEEKKKMNLDEMKKAKMPLNNEEMSMVSGAGDGLWMVFQKTYTDFRFKRHINRGDRDQFIVEDHHEALVSREDFEAAGKMLKQHAKEKNVTNGDEKYQRRYPFTKKIICGECGSNFKRRINTTASAKYPVWVCKEHIEHIENCSMKYVKEAALKNAFCTMMNKLIFARTPVLHSLLDAFRSQNHKESLLRVNTINTELEGLGEHRQTLISIMTKGYIDRAAYTREMNALTTEATALEAERERLTKEVGGDMRKVADLKVLLKYTGKGEMLSEFDAALFERFVDHMRGSVRPAQNTAKASSRWSLTHSQEKSIWC